MHLEARVLAPLAIALCLLCTHAAEAHEPDLLGLGRPRVGLVQRTHELGVNIFRNPSIGLELRAGPVSVHVGGYPTVLSRSDARGRQTTWFLKAGATLFVLPHILYGREVNELYLQASYMRGLNHRYTHGFMADIGYRFMIWRGLNARLGVAMLVAPGRTTHINPTPGAGWSYAW
jgi:hypothetical protein